MKEQVNISFFHINGQKKSRDTKKCITGFVLKKAMLFLVFFNLFEIGINDIIVCGPTACGASLSTGPMLCAGRA
jgi:hypothetical protein